MRSIFISICMLCMSNIFMTAVYYLKEPLKLDYLWAALCVVGAVFFVFRSKLPGVTIDI